MKALFHWVQHKYLTNREGKDKSNATKALSFMESVNLPLVH